MPIVLAKVKKLFYFSRVMETFDPTIHQPGTETDHGTFQGQNKENGLMVFDKGGSPLQVTATLSRSFKLGKYIAPKYDGPDMSDHFERLPRYRMD